MQNTRIRSFVLRVDQHVRCTTAPCLCGVFCGGVVVFLYFCFLWWCSCGGVLVLIFFCWCSRAGLFVVVWSCLCGGVLAPVFLWWCGDVFVLVWSGVVVFLWWCSCGGVCVVVLVWQTTKRIRRASDNFSQKKASKMIVFMRCFRQFSQKKLPEWSFRARLPPNFKEKSFQNDCFVRCFRQFSRTELPKRAFRAMPPTIFTEKTSKMIVSCEASFKFHRTMLPKTSVSHDASDNFHRKSFQNDRFRARASSKFHRTMLPKTSVFARCFRQFFTKNLRFATVSRNRHTDSCERVHPPKAKCASHYNAVHSQMWTMCVFASAPCAKNVMNLSTVNRPASRTQKCNILLQFWAIDTNVFTERVHREQMKFAFRYSFGRSTPRFYREGWPLENEICVSLQFLGDRRHVF